VVNTGEQTRRWGPLGGEEKHQGPAGLSSGEGGRTGQTRAGRAAHPGHTAGQICSKEARFIQRQNGADPQREGKGRASGRGIPRKQGSITREAQPGRSAGSRNAQPAETAGRRAPPAGRPCRGDRRGKGRAMPEAYLQEGGQTLLGADL
jgi:hypothetical protein